jgi:uncharacterized protein (DUF2164 family)
MTEIKRKWGILSEDQRANRIKEIISFFKVEREEVLGVVAAGEILDFFLQTVSQDVYAKATDDVRKLLEERFKDIEIDLDVLRDQYHGEK